MHRNFVFHETHYAVNVLYFLDVNNSSNYTIWASINIVLLLLSNFLKM